MISNIQFDETFNPALKSRLERLFDDLNALSSGFLQSDNLRSLKILSLGEREKEIIEDSGYDYHALFNCGFYPDNSRIAMIMANDKDHNIHKTMLDVIHGLVQSVQFDQDRFPYIDMGPTFYMGDYAAKALAAHCESKALTCALVHKLAESKPEQYHALIEEMRGRDDKGLKIFEEAAADNALDLDPSEAAFWAYLGDPYTRIDTQLNALSQYENFMDAYNHGETDPSTEISLSFDIGRFFDHSPISFKSSIRTQLEPRDNLFFGIDAELLDQHSDFDYINIAEYDYKGRQAKSDIHSLLEKKGFATLPQGPRPLSRFENSPPKP